MSVNIPNVKDGYKATFSKSWANLKLDKSMEIYDNTHHNQMSKN